MMDGLQKEWDGFSSQIQLIETTMDEQDCIELSYHKPNSRLVGCLFSTFEFSWFPDFW